MNLLEITTPLANISLSGNPALIVGMLTVIAMVIGYIIMIGWLLVWSLQLIKWCHSSSIEWYRRSFADWRSFDDWCDDIQLHGFVDKRERTRRATSDMCRGCQEGRPQPGTACDSFDECSSNNGEDS